MASHAQPKLKPNPWALSCPGPCCPGLDDSTPLLLLGFQTRLLVPHFLRSCGNGRTPQQPCRLGIPLSGPGEVFGHDLRPCTTPTPGTLNLRPAVGTRMAGWALGRRRPPTALPCPRTRPRTRLGTAAHPPTEASRPRRRTTGLSTPCTRLHQVVVWPWGVPLPLRLQLSHSPRR